IKSADKGKLVADLEERSRPLQFAHDLAGLCDRRNIETDDQPIVQGIRRLAHRSLLAANSQACSTRARHILCIAARRRSSLKPPSSSNASLARGTEHCAVTISAWQAISTARR